MEHPAIFLALGAVLIFIAFWKSIAKLALIGAVLLALWMIL